MYVIIETGGKQYRVQEGDILDIEKLSIAAGQTLDVERVLMINQDGQVQFGTPYVSGAKVVLEVAHHGKGRKIIVFKYKAKKNYRRKQGHRQQFTKVIVKSIEFDAQKPELNLKKEVS